MWPISVKGVLGWEATAVLLRNERDEWELPGGRLETGDSSLPAALRREILEELAIDVDVGRLLDTWIYEPVPGRRVVIVTFACSAPRPDVLEHSDEHTAVETFGLDELDGLPLPDGYRRSILTALG
jgi:8-oxo-dGTP pyrophosphatase MutT (NUDIX family)